MTLAIKTKGRKTQGAHSARRGAERGVKMRKKKDRRKNKREKICKWSKQLKSGQKKLCFFDFVSQKLKNRMLLDHKSV